MNTRQGVHKPRLFLTSVVMAASCVALAGTDLVLPAVPMLPAVLGGSTALAQYVLAAYVAGSAAGLLLFGALAARREPLSLLVLSLLAFGGVSLAIAAADTLDRVIALRFLQGLAGAAPAVLAPVLIRALHDGSSAVRMMGLLGSIESLVPALAPLAGLWLLQVYGWTASFVGTGVLALVLAAIVRAMARPDVIAALSVTGFKSGSGSPSDSGADASTPAASTLSNDKTVNRLEEGGGYRHLLGDARYLRQALSQALCLGGLLVFVFGAPVVMVQSLRGELSDFVVMQMAGITCFIIAANGSARVVRRWGAEQTILAGTVLSACGALLMLVYGLAGGTSLLVVVLLFMPFNLGLGLRGPPGFYQAVLLAGRDAGRGAALVILAAQLTAATGTALVAPWIEAGLVPLAAVAATISGSAVVVLLAVRGA